MVVDRLVTQIKQKQNPCIVGIDPDWSKIPSCYQMDGVARPEGILHWATDVIDAVKDIVPAVKPQIAFFEALGAEGISVYQKIVRYAHGNGLLVIDDSKRGDIGNTAAAYAFAHLANDGPINADFLTVSPFLGTDSLQPFVETAAMDGKGLFVLVKTSNPSSAELSEAVNPRGEKLRDWLADYVCRTGEDLKGECGYSLIGAVVGATFPAEARQLRWRMKHSFFLVPGFGAQGGSAKDVVSSFNADGLGAVVNSSRGVLYHHLKTEDYDGTKEMYMDIVRKQAMDMQRTVYTELKAVCKHMAY